MSKLPEKVSIFPSRLSLERTSWLARMALVMVVMGVLLAACTVNPVSEGTGGSPSVETAAEARPISVMDTEANAPDSAAATDVQIDALDADAIVAAHEQVLSGIYQRLVPSVVRIRSVRQLDQTSGLPDIPGLPDFERSSGSGFVWDDEGHIVTNHHVISGAGRVTVIFEDGTELEAAVLGSDPDSDLAVLQVEPGEHAIPAVEVGDSSTVQVGSIAVAIGNPFGQEFTITSGIISAVGRTIRSGNSQFSIPQVIQTDAPINPGNSGGPLLDRHGRVIGVNTQIISNSGGSSGIGFAVPINTAKRVVPRLIEDGKYEYAWLGISGTTLTGDTAELAGLPRNAKGTLIIEVAPGGPAANGGLKGSDSTSTIDGIEFPVGGDIIVAINGSPIEEMDQLITYLIENTNPGDKAEVEVIRGGNTRETLTVTLGKRPGL